jgi:hypothetical protein
VSTWEGGVRVPGIVYWKGMITPGQINDGLFYQVAAGMSSGDDDMVNPGAMTTVETYPFSKMFNLYLDPKESHSFMVRKILLSSTFSNAYFAHLATFQKYPPKTQVSGAITQ